MKTRFTASFLVLLVLLLVILLDFQRLEPIQLIPTISGEIEYCLTCHQDLPEISQSHPIESFGCISCHGGERLSLDENLAHSTMRGGNNPSDLSVVEESCGGSSCHSGASEDYHDHIQRVMTSIQSTYAGAIASVRYSFGAQDDLIAHMGIYPVQDKATLSGISSLSAINPAQETHPALRSFSENCVNCHISAEPLPGKNYSRLTGCGACHSPLNPEGESSHTLTSAIPYTQCNTCHNRGNYSLLDMQFHPRSDQYTGRLFEYYQPIAQFVQCEYTLDCIDCHTREEAMGDGDIHSSQDEIQYVGCKSCHGTLTTLPLEHTIQNQTDLALKMASLNPVINLRIGDTILVTENDEPLWNTRLLPDGTYELFGKATGQRFIFRAVKVTSCGQDPIEQESHYCHECHAVER